MGGGINQCVLNEEYKLVSREEVEALAGDVLEFFNCIANQKVMEIDRGSYWKWRAMGPFEAKAELRRELDALTPES